MAQAARVLIAGDYSCAERRFASTGGQMKEINADLQTAQQRFAEVLKSATAASFVAQLFQQMCSESLLSAPVIVSGDAQTMAASISDPSAAFLIALQAQTAGVHVDVRSVGAVGPTKFSLPQLVMGDIENTKVPGKQTCDKISDKCIRCGKKIYCSGSR
jgi:hypothetical protein